MQLQGDLKLSYSELLAVISITLHTQGCHT